MSLTTDPDPSDGCPAFIPLEANPELMTTLIHKLGVSDALEIHDVYSLTEPEMLAFIPRPALALLLVFPISAVYESQRMAEDSLVDEYKGKGDTEPVLWWPQTIRNACGLMGLLHAVTNGNARNFIEEGSTLDKVIKKSMPLDARGRAKVLESTPELATAHKEAATQGDTPAPAAEDDVELHYVCFAKGTDNGLWELDGRRKGPIRRGDLDDNEDVLSSKGLALGALKFLEREGADLRFSAVALAGKRRSRIRIPYVSAIAVTSPNCCRKFFNVVNCSLDWTDRLTWRSHSAIEVEMDKAELKPHLVQLPTSRQRLSNRITKHHEYVSIPFADTNANNPGIARWLLRKGTEHTGLVLGNDASGKTTFLYKLLLGEIVQTIPTIGFNVETLECPDGDKITLWDIGGCDMIRPLTRHYMLKDRFVIFIQSCEDLEPDRIEFSMEYLRMAMEMMESFEAKNLFILFNKQDHLSPENAASIVRDLKSQIEKEIKPYENKLDIRILDYPGLSALNGTHLHAAMEEIRMALKPTKPTPNVKAEIEQKVKGPSEDDLVNRIRQENATSVDAQTFWKRFLDGSLESWDHYTHLRAGFFVLRDCFARGVGVLGCADEFMAHLNRLREGDPEKFRNTAHRTMTIFWLQQIQVAAIEYQANNSPGKFPGQEKYADILFSAPHLMNSGLWRAYYTKDSLFTPQAKENWHLPDIQPLPTISQVTSRPPQKISGNDADRLPRFAFSVVQKTLSSQLRRGGIVKQAFEALQSSTMRLRATDSSIPPYSETQAYFWIQIIHAYLRSLQVQVSGSLTFEAFKSLFDVKGDEWRQYYSQSVWESIPARMSFVNPDKKALPNVFGMPSQARMDMARTQMVNAISHRFAEPLDMPPREDLDFLAAVLIDEAKLMPESELNVASHASLLRYLFNRLSGKSEGSATSRASSTAMEVAQRVGLTQSMFWVQRVQIEVARNKDVGGFEEFVKGNSYLAFEDLPFVYYSPQLWESAEARGAYVPPDRRAVSSIVGGRM
uniref:Ubiquitin carboxyl-terminal hydrolase n=1 Tax=Gibberella zeae TaxID=5518 RepID=A0A4E9DWQ4_GIBZA